MYLCTYPEYIVTVYLTHILGLYSGFLLTYLAGIPSGILLASILGAFYAFYVAFHVAVYLEGVSSLLGILFVISLAFYLLVFWHFSGILADILW